MVDTLVHRTLGEKRIREICNQWGLDEKDKDIIDEVLVEWQPLIGRIEQKVEVAISKVGDNPRIKQIIGALLEISVEFTKKRLEGGGTSE